MPVQVDDLPTGWEAFATNDALLYFSFPQVFYYCRQRSKVQWARPTREDALEAYPGTTINGKRPYEVGSELIPAPPPLRPYNGPLADATYKASTENPEDVFQPDEDLLEAALEGDLQKAKAALNDGADVTLQNQPWRNSVLHLASCPYFWDADTVQKEKAARLELTQFFVRQGAELDAENLYNCKAIDLALFHGYDDVVKFLQTQGSKHSIFGAAYKGDLGRVIELLQEGVDIDLRGRYGRTAFAEAHLQGHWQVETFLAQQGCSRALPHPENMKFNPGGAALPRVGGGPRRERQYYREDDPVWYDDMMEKRFPGYLATLAKKPAV